MFAALLAAFGVKDCVYGGFIIGLIIFGSFAWIQHDHRLRAEGAAHERQALIDSGNRLLAQNAIDIHNKEEAWKAESDKAGALYEATLATQSAAIGVLNQRLRDAARANSSGHAVPGEAATPAESDGPTRLSGPVERALEGVVAGAEHDAAQVIGLQNYVRKVCLADQPPNTASGVR